MTRSSDRKAPARVSPGAEDELDLGRHLGLLFEYRISILVTLMLTVLGGALYAAVATPTYRANTVLQFEQKGSSLGELDQLLADFSGEAATEIEILSSRTLLARVIDELHLDIVAEPRHFPLVGAALARSYRGTTPAEPPLWGLGRFAWGGERIQVDQLEVPPELEDVPLTLVVGVEEDGHYKPLGLPAQVKIHFSELQARPGTEFRVMRRSRLAAVEALQHALRVSEKSPNTGVLMATLEGDDPARLTATLQGIADHYVRYNVERKSAEAERTLAFLESQLPGLREKVEHAEAALSAHRAGKGNVDLDMEAQSILNRSTDVEKAISALLLERSELRQRFTERHPMLIATANKLARLRSEQSALNAQLKSLPSAELETAQLTRDVKVANELYLQLNNKAQEYRVLTASTVSNSRILDAPVVSRQPVSPNKSGVLAVSFVLGLTLGIALAFTRQALRSGVSDPGALEAALGVPVYATLPFGKRQARRARGRLAILASKHPRDLVTESLRGLRTRLELALKDASNPVIAITGPSPGVGKSFVSVNLAWVMADSGKRTLLVDGNLRGGWIHRCFRGERSLGLSEVLRGTAPLEQAVVRALDPRLSFLSSGTLPPNPAELLMSAEFAKLVARLSADYDVVIIDTPPILAVTDAALVGRHAGLNLAVVRAGAHPMRELAAALHRLEQNGVPVQGLILNGVPRSSSARTASGIYQYEYPTAS